MKTNHIKEALFWLLCIAFALAFLAFQIQQQRQLADLQATSDRIEDRFTVHERTPTPFSIPAPTYSTD